MSPTDIFEWLFGYGGHAAAADDYADRFLRESGLTEEEQLSVSVGWVNAFAHAYVSAMIAYEQGPATAEFLGNAREWWTSGVQDAPPEDAFVDIYNNHIGRQIGRWAAQNGLSPDRIAELVAEAAIEGLQDDPANAGRLILSVNDRRVPPVASNPYSRIAGLIRPIVDLASPTRQVRYLLPNREPFTGFADEFPRSQIPVWTPPPPMTEEEREAYRQTLLRNFSVLIQNADAANTAGNDAGFNRAWADLHDALRTYEQTFGRDAGAMEAARPYQAEFERLSANVRSVPERSGWPATAPYEPGRAYTGADLGADQLRSGQPQDAYTRFRSAVPPAEGIPAGTTTEQYFSRAYRAADPFRAALGGGTPAPAVGQPAAPASPFGFARAFEANPDVGLAALATGPVSLFGGGPAQPGLAAPSLPFQPVSLFAVPPGGTALNVIAAALDAPAPDGRALWEPVKGPLAFDEPPEPVRFGETPETPAKSWSAGAGAAEPSTDAPPVELKLIDLYRERGWGTDGKGARDPSLPPPLGNDFPASAWRKPKRLR